MSSIKKQRLSVLWEIDSLTETHCKPCDVRSVNEGCQECQIGIQIRQLGSKLGKVKVPKIEKKVPKRKGGKKVEFTKEAYQAVKKEGKTDKEIKTIFGIDQNKLYKMKKEWGLIAQNKPSWTKSEEEYKSLIGQLEGELEGRDDLIDKLEETIKKYEQTPSPDEDIKILNQKVESVEDELDQYKTKLRIAANALDQSNDKLQELESLMKDLSYRLDTSENEKEKAVDQIMELRSKNATAERELLIAEDNLKQANILLRSREADIEIMERELSYARENERTLKANDLIFKAALKAAL